jgi:hypothetical protein
VTSKKTWVVVLLVTSAVAAWAEGRTRVAADMATAARQFLASLAPAQRASASIAFGDDERSNWHFVPRARKGLPLKGLTPAQQKLADAWLATGLSAEGHATARNIMFLDSVLREIERGNPTRDPEAYNFTVFGEPSEKGTWGARFEGHHISLNFTLHGGEVVAATPSFFGANPAIVKDGPRAGLRTLPNEELIARELFRSFQGETRAKVLIDVRAPADIITGASRKAEPGPPVGIAFAEMSKEQARMLLDLMGTYALRWRPEVAEAEMKKVQNAGLEKIHFAWAGGSEPGQPHYYRIQGPTFLIEYDNTQNNANHIHSVWRDLNNDFGTDVLRAHYESSPPHEVQRLSAHRHSW